MRGGLLASSALAIGLLATATNANSQEAARSSTALERETKAVLGESTPLSRTGAAISSSNLQIATTKDEQELALGIDFELFSSAPIDIPDDVDTFRVNSLNLTLTGSTSLNSDADSPSDFFSGGSFVSGTKISAALTYFTTTHRNGEGLFFVNEERGQLNLRDEIISACATKTATMFGSTPEKLKQARLFVQRVNGFSSFANELFEKDKATIIAFLRTSERPPQQLIAKLEEITFGVAGKTISEEIVDHVLADARLNLNDELRDVIGEFDSTRNPTLPNFIRVTLKRDPQLKGIVDQYEKACDQKTVDDLANEYLPEARDRFVSAAYTTDPLWFFGASGSLGDEDFSVLNRNDFLVETVSRNPWEVKGYAGLIGPDLNWSARASIAYGSSFEAAEDAEFCQMEMDDEPDCITGPDGNPIRDNSGRVALEGRVLFDLAKGNGIGFAPEVTYDLEEEDWIVEAPIYFSPNKEGQLTGGIITRYESDDNDFSVGLFIGVPFSVRF